MKSRRGLEMSFNLSSLNLIQDVRGISLMTKRTVKGLLVTRIKTPMSL